MEGVPLLRRCKEDFPDMPVILMTAGSSLTEQEAIKIGAAGFISKPFSWDDLLKLIKSVMT
jgi:two-component system NtrC family response regulator